jgi:F0F1-type ATP synthase delta subunit
VICLDYAQEINGKLNNMGDISKSYKKLIDRHVYLSVIEILKDYNLSDKEIEEITNRIWQELKIVL